MYLHSSLKKSKPKYLYRSVYTLQRCLWSFGLSTSATTGCSSRLCTRRWVASKYNQLPLDTCGNNVFRIFPFTLCQRTFIVSIFRRSTRVKDSFYESRCLKMGEKNFMIKLCWVIIYSFSMIIFQFYFNSLHGLLCNTTDIVVYNCLERII